MFFGVREPGMRMKEFWARYDPDNTRADCGGSNLSSSATPEPVVPIPRVGGKSKRSQQTPKVNAKHRVENSATPPPIVNTKTRRSLASKVDAERTDTLQSTQQPEVEASISQRPARASTIARTLSVEKKSTRTKGTPKAAAASRNTKRTRESTSLVREPEARTSATMNDGRMMDVLAPRRLAPVPKKPTKQAEKKQKQKHSTVQGNAKVTKQKTLKKRTLAPSPHKMRTRAQGPAGNLQLS